ncbi:MAG TPA: hypothetical protein VGH23_04850 [Rhizomicrobium sp.]
MRYASLALILLSAFCAAPALAGPREDSLAGISRCAALPDDRTFLDCVYGAMQPMRAELGLPPALPAQQRLVPPAYYSSRSVPPPSAQAVVPPPVPVQPGSIPPQSASNDGGLFSGVFSGSGLQMASYAFDKRGLFTVTLSDGSVWKQDPNDTNFAHFGGKASKYSVTLHPGDFGKARMNVRGEGGPYLVARIR